MSEGKRYLIAGLLIFIIILLNPLYYDLIGYNEVNQGVIKEPSSNDGSVVSLEKNPEGVFESNLLSPPLKNSKQSDVSSSKEIFEIITPLYNAHLSNASGGSLESFSLLEESGDDGVLKYTGQLNEHGEYDKDSPVQLIFNDEMELNCKPCIYDSKQDSYWNHNFQLQDIVFSDEARVVRAANKTNINLNENDTVSVLFSYSSANKEIVKKTIFYGNSYVIDHNYEVVGFELAELSWMGGIRPVEKKEYDDNPNTLVYYSQNGDRDYTSALENNSVISKTVIQEKLPVDWVALRNKYFITSLINRSHADYIVYSGKDVNYANRSMTPVFNFGLGYKNPSKITTSMYIGPLEIDQVNKSNTSLSTAMDFGWGPMKYIGMAILYFVKQINNILGLNYGLVLILFAFLMRLITGPLTKKSFESTQKMQQLQPQIKKLQEKYKNDSARLQRETMALYQKHGANPLGGCLPMLIQMPVLISLFQVFRYTIEFRNEPFFLWISDLSQPDVVVSLPFYIPLYGDGIAVLPLIMGASLIMTMRISSATMDPAQKPMMYIMNIFFIVLFNTFPSGLNLYYTTYNFLNYWQQKQIKQDSKPA